MQKKFLHQRLNIAWNIKYSMEYTRTRRKIKSKCVYIVILCIFLYLCTLRKDVNDLQENPKNSWDIALTQTQGPHLEKPQSLEVGIETEYRFSPVYRSSG